MASEPIVVSIRVECEECGVRLKSPMEYLCKSCQFDADLYQSYLWDEYL